MAMTIGPAGGEAERRRLLRWHAAGMLMGSAITGFTLALAGALIGARVGWLGGVAGLVVAALLIGWGARFATGHGLAYPRSHWQVPDHWRYTLPLPFTMLVYGVLLGLGWVTDVVSPVYWMLVGYTLLIAAPAIALSAWAGYGSVRILSTVSGTSKARRHFEPSNDDDFQPAVCAPNLHVLTAMRAASGLVIAGSAVALVTSGIG